MRLISRLGSMFEWPSRKRRAAKGHAGKPRADADASTTGGVASCGSGGGGSSSSSGGAAEVASSTFSSTCSSPSRLSTSTVPSVPSLERTTETASAAPSPAGPSQPRPARADKAREPLPADEPDVLGVWAEMDRTDMAQAVREGRKLGQGAEGAVVEVVLAGRKCAVKSIAGISHEGMLGELTSPFVQQPLAMVFQAPATIPMCGGEALDEIQYMAYTLRAGPLDEAWVALPAAAAASTATPRGCHRSATAAAPAAVNAPKSGNKLKALLRRGKASSTAVKAAAPKTRQPLSAAVPVFADMAAGLAAAHAKGWKHGDVKPGNYLVSHGPGHVVLGDWGLSGEAGERAAGCTPLFASPEVLAEMPKPHPVLRAAAEWCNKVLGPGSLLERLLRGLMQGGRAEGGEVDRRGADVWALGASYALMMAGDEEAPDLVRCLERAQRGGALRLPASLAAEPALAGLLRGMLAVDEGARLSIEGVMGHELFAGVGWGDLAVYGAAGRPPLLEALAAQREREAREQAAGASVEDGGMKAAASVPGEAAAGGVKVKAKKGGLKGLIKRACRELRARG